MPKIGRVVAAALAGAIVSAAAAQDAVQWRVEDGGNGHWYEARLLVGSTWDDAAEFATSRGGYLATATSALEHDLIFGMIDSPEYWITSSGVLSGPYIGGYRERGSSSPASGWRWLTEETWKFTAWASGQPNSLSQNALHFWTDGGVRAPTWNDIPSDESSAEPGSLVIEWSADCNGDGVVDYGQILDGTYADHDGNGVPDCCDLGVECDCPADLNSDGMVGPPDLGILLALWSTDGSPNGADLNGDGTVTAADLGLLVGAWGACN